MANPNPTTMQLKLLIDKKEQKVLFAEAGKDFVDFVFTLVSLPFATAVKLLKRHNEHADMAGSLATIYQSIENFDVAYLQPNVKKDTLLAPFFDVKPHPLLSGNWAHSGLAPVAKRMYACGSPPPAVNNSSNIFSFYALNISNGGSFKCCPHVTEDPRNCCPGCNKFMTREINYVPSLAAKLIEGSSSTSSTTSCGSDNAGGCVKGLVRYLVMDDLEVKTMSTISSLSMLSTFNVKAISDLEEKTVSLGLDEVNYACL